MTTSLVYRTVRRSNRKLLILAIVGALLLIGLAVLNKRYFYNFFYGPFTIDKQTLLAIDDASTSRQYWVTVDGDDAIDTGFQEVRSKDGSESVAASFLAVLFDDKALLVKAPYNYGVIAGLKLTKYTGYLEPMSSDIRTRIVADAEQETPSLRGAFLPYVLNTDRFRDVGYGSLALGIPLFLLCIVGLILAIKRYMDPFAHPMIRALCRFGPADDVAGQIDAEMRAEHPNVGKLHLTSNWLVQVTSTRLDATRIDDVVWAYRHIARHRGGVTYAAHVWDRHGVCISVGGKEAFVNQALQAVARRAPWILTGYTAQLEQTWKQNRPSVVEAVDVRRRQIMVQDQGVPVLV